MLFDIPKQLLQELTNKLHEAQGEKLSKSTIRSLLEAALRKCDLVSRDEFDAQTAVLHRTREKVEQLQKDLETLQSNMEKDSK